MTAVLVSGLVAACTGDADSPDPDGPTSSSDKPSEDQLPVVTSFVVDGGTTSPQDVRVAIHGVRRVEGGSVLDWSVTPLAGEGQTVGDRVGQRIDINVEPSLENGQALRLVDVDAAKVYRPLDNGGDAVGCLCVPWFKVAGNLEVGTTTVMQAAFPELPESLESITVANQGQPVAEDVPIAGRGQVLVGPTADLAAPAPAARSASSPASFTYPVKSGIRDPEQKMTLTVDEVIAGASSTTLRFTVTSTEAGKGLNTLGGLPVGDTTLVPYGTMLFESSASAPGIQLTDDTGSRVMRAWFAGVTQKSDLPTSAPKGFAWRECLCSVLARTGRQLAQPDRSLSLVVQMPALPAGTDKVDVVFPRDSLPTVTDVPVTPMAEVEDFSLQDAKIGTWSYGSVETSSLPEGWTVDDWPTPVPTAAEMTAAKATVDDLEQIFTDEVSTEKKDEKAVEVTLDSTVSFKPDSAALTPKALATIKRIAKDIDTTAAAGQTVLVEGHVAGSDRGSEAVQKRLSQQRADAVRKALESASSSSIRFKAVGRGATQPVAPNDSEEHRKLNRRVVVSYER